MIRSRAEYPPAYSRRHEVIGLSSGLKYELDALANKDFQYLTKRYLPRKLKEKDWLD